MIEIRWKCRCLLKEASLRIEARTAGQGVVEWMDEVVRPLLTTAHQRRSPMCSSDRLTYLKIPTPDNAPFLGAQPKLDS